MCADTTNPSCKNAYDWNSSSVLIILPFAQGDVSFSLWVNPQSIRVRSSTTYVSTSSTYIHFTAVDPATSGLHLCLLGGTAFAHRAGTELQLRQLSAGPRSGTANAEAGHRRNRTGGVWRPSGRAKPQTRGVGSWWMCWEPNNHSFTKDLTLGTKCALECVLGVRVGTRLAASPTTEEFRSHGPLATSLSETTRCDSLPGELFSHQVTVLCPLWCLP